MLVAILLVALGTIIAAAVAYESAMTARRSTATLSFDEALLVSEGAEALAAYGLKTVMQMSKPGRQRRHRATSMRRNSGHSLWAPWRWSLG